MGEELLQNVRSAKQLIQHLVDARVVEQLVCVGCRRLLGGGLLLGGVLSSPAHPSRICLQLLPALVRPRKGRSRRILLAVLLLL